MIDNAVQFLRKKINASKITFDTGLVYEVDFFYFSMQREDFLDTYEIRLEISESEYKYGGMGVEINGLKELIDNVKKSSVTAILIIEFSNRDITFYANTELTILFGYIGDLDNFNSLIAENLSSP